MITTNINSCLLIVKVNTELSRKYSSTFNADIATICKKIAEYNYEQKVGVGFYFDELNKDLKDGFFKIKIICDEDNLYKIVHTGNLDCLGTIKVIG